MERNARVFKDRVWEIEDIYEKAKFSASLWASTDKSFKHFPFPLIIYDWKDVLDPNGI